jgi:heme/copper-type cytochrome/quinol oxidase subunit 2
MKTLLRLFLSLCVLTMSPAVMAQQPEMADTMRSEGKIYVVVSIVLVVVLGLIGYLFVLDRKITRLEKDK